MRAREVGVASAFSAVRGQVSLHTPSERQVNGNASPPPTRTAAGRTAEARGRPALARGEWSPSPGPRFPPATLPSLQSVPSHAACSRPRTPLSPGIGHHRPPSRTRGRKKHRPPSARRASVAQNAGRTAPRPSAIASDIARPNPPSFQLPGLARDHKRSRARRGSKRRRRRPTIPSYTVSNIQKTRVAFGICRKRCRSGREGWNRRVGPALRRAGCEPRVTEL